MYLLTMKFESIKSVFIITNHLNWYHPVLSGLLENIFWVSKLSVILWFHFRCEHSARSNLPSTFMI